MHGVGLEAAIVADRPKECHRLDADVGVVHLDALVLHRPRPRDEGVEGEHVLFHPHQLHVPEPSDLEGVVHLAEELVVVRVGVGLEASINADRPKECHCLDPDVSIVDLDALVIG